MKIAILGTRGIPNAYGGFEQFAEYLSKYLVQNGHAVTVYSSSNHPFKKSTWNNVNIVHIYDPENLIGTAGQFIYDLNCILHSRNAQYDLVLQLGYTSSSIWGFLFRKNQIVVTNMDGIEWKRSKYSKLTQHFLKIAERLGIKYSDNIISDSIGIKNYLDDKYKINSKYIAYGANIFYNPDQSILQRYNLIAFEYDMILARTEPENNIETIINGFTNSSTNRKLIVIGNHSTNFGKKLQLHYRDSRLNFMDPIYDINILNNLRYYSQIYFHGHSVGGTNPSLLEAMASQSLIIAHDNVFNKKILENEAFYFSSEEEITTLINKIRKEDYHDYIQKNLAKITESFNWDKINHEYENHFISIIE